jgi:CubicO group peptidase (beta-lactamase class C family)
MRKSGIAFLSLGLATVRAQMPVAAGDPGPGQVLAESLERATPHLAAGGFVAAEVQDDAVRYLLAGNPAPRAGIPPERIIFEVGSIAKLVSGLLLAEAVVEHRVALADPIRRWLPASVALDPRVAAITLGELATHTSGLPRLPPNLRVEHPLDPFAAYPVADLYGFLSAYKPAAAPPRPADYSNLGAGLLGYILERVYQEPYGRLVAEKVAIPLGLADTTVLLNEEQQTRLAVPHLGAHPVRPQGAAEVFLGATGLYSTAADLVRLTHVLMLPPDHPLAEAWAIACQPRAAFPAMNGQTGLGVLIAEKPAGPIYWHGGTTAGTRSHLEWSPSQRHALVVLMDSDSIEAMNLVVTLYSLAVPAK